MRPSCDLHKKTKSRNYCPDCIQRDINAFKAIAVFDYKQKVRDAIEDFRIPKYVKDLLKDNLNL